MHLNFAFTTVQTLWALTFAGLLVLLVVLLGRDRARRSPIFTFSICLIALRLLASRLLFGRMDPILSGVIFLVLALVASLTMVAVLVEQARHAFKGASARNWIVGSSILGIVGLLGTILWGKWPAWSAITGPTASVLLLHLAQIVAQRLYQLADLLAIELCLLVLYAGHRFQSGWKSLTQKIIIGLAVAGFAESGVRALWQYIATHTIPHSQAEYEHAIGMQEKLYNANSILYILVLVWWIYWLWREEPGAAPQLALVATPVKKTDEAALPANTEETVATPVAETPAAEGDASPSTGEEPPKSDKSE